ncbi:hypothetical protein BGZ54_010378 [Gamsiella multidivaricata]|nr:hypothetical protein BGZ54_010378 [Gamsiella multidivaricata]
MSNRERSTRHKSRIPRPIIKRTSSNLSSRRISSGASSLFATPVRESDDKVKNPFLVPAQSLTITTTKSIYATSQWRSEFPHHVSQEYLEALFSSDQYVPLRASLTAAVDSASYLDMRYDVNGTILGAGEFSEVVKVQDRVTKELFAVKKLKKSVQGVMERKRFLAEARNMWKIGHPNVVSLLGVWEQRAKIYMRMELCRSESLRSAMASHMKYGGFNEGYIWRSLRDISSGLQAIHESNIVHLDIKPENIFIGSAGSLKVGDFGHSVMLPLQDADGLEGDRRYMAPELLYGHCNTYSDIFSLGIMVYEMISNRCSELPGEGREWHSLREGDIDFTAGQYCYANLEAQSSHVERDLSSPAPTLSLSATVDLRIKTCRKNFCKELFDLVKEMMQPICEKRLQAAAICALAEQAGTRFSISSELQAYYSLPT